MTSPATDGGGTYQLTVDGHLDDHWAASLGDLTLLRLDDGTTTLTGAVVDQAQLHGLLARVRDLGVTLLTVRVLESATSPSPAAEVQVPAAPVPIWRIELGERRVLRPGRFRWLRAMVWMVVLFFLTAGTFGLPLQWANDLLPSDDVGRQLLATVIACTTALLGYAVAVRLGEGRSASELAFRPAARDLIAGTLLGFVLMALLMGVQTASGLYDVAPGGSAVPWTALGLALQAAVTEELWMRGLLFRLVWRALGAVPAFLLSAAAFAALHLANAGAGVLSTATVAIAGLMFCAVYALTRRLWAPIGLHFAWNLAQGYLFGATVSGGDLGGSLLVSTPADGAPTWLTGGTFGPEASVIALGLVTLVTALTLLAARSRVRTAAST